MSNFPVKRKLLLALVFIFLLTIPVLATDELQRAFDQLAETEARAGFIRGNIEWARVTTEQLNHDLRVLDWLMHSSQAELERLRGNLLRLDEDIITTGAHLFQVELNLAEVDALARERIRVLYKNGNISFFEVLFTSTSYSDFLQRAELLRRLVESDIALLSQTQQLQLELDNAKRQLEASFAEQQRMEQQESWHNRQLEVQQDEKHYLIGDIQAQAAHWVELQAELAAEGERLGAWIREMQEARRGFALGTGDYTWPVPGHYTVSSRFGWRPNPFGGSSSNWHSGLDIAAPNGANIVAVDAGVVVLASIGWNGGYGNMVMIDHGNGVATLYAHASSILVTEEQAVARGEVIASIGSTGWSTGPHLHIEFRINGTAEDPANFLE